MTDLDRAECEKLRDWGLDQALEPGDKFWGNAIDETRCWTLMFFLLGEQPKLPWFKIPSLETLLKFADIAGEKKYGGKFNGTSLTSNSDVKRGGIGIYSAWSWEQGDMSILWKDGDGPDEMPIGSDDIPKRAVYKLIKILRAEG